MIICIGRDDLIAYLPKPQDTLCNHEFAITYLRRTHAGEGEHFRQFQPSWLKSYPWLHYSAHVDGAFCRAYFVFRPEVVGGQNAGQLVSKTFRSLKKIDKLADHAKREYHLSCMAKMKEFVT